MWSEAIALFREYMGTGLIVMWFLIAMIYLWINEKRKHIRILFLYAPTVLLILFFNPLFAELVYGLAGNEIYYRILWLLPITMVIAYAAVHIYGNLSEKRKGLYALCVAAMIMVSGSYIYSNPFFDKAEHIYHVPDEVVEICDAITVPGREVMAIFPLELLQYVRQYSPTTRMPYGREVIVETWGYTEDIYDAVEAEAVDLEVLVPLSRERGCHYVVLRADKEVIGELKDYDWTVFMEVGDYVVYRDMGVELIIPDLDTLEDWW